MAHFAGVAIRIDLAAQKPDPVTRDTSDRLEMLETTAEALINSRLLGEVVPMSDAVIAELTKAFSIK